MINDQNGQKISGATVSIAGQSDSTSSSGYYSIDGISPGSYKLRATKSSYDNYSTDVSLTAGRTKTKNIRLNPTGAGVKPVITSVDEMNCHFYLEGYDLFNTYKVTVNWKGAEPGEVRFILNGIRSTDTSEPWKKTYNMGRDFVASLNGNANTLKIIAVNQWGDKSSAKVFHLWVVPFPDWLANLLEEGGNLTSGSSSWTLKGDMVFPEPAFEAQIDDPPLPDWLPFIGGHSFGIEETQANVSAKLRSSGAGEIRLGGGTSFTAMNCGAGGRISGTGNFQLSSSKGIYLTGADFKLDLSGRLTKSFGILDCIPGMAGLDFPGKDWVDDHVSVTPEVNPEIFTRFYFGSKDSFPWLDYQQGTARLGCGVKATLSIYIDYIGELIVRGGGTPRITLQVPKAPGYLKKLEAVLNAGFRIIGWGYELYSWEVNYYWSNGRSRKKTRESSPVILGCRPIPRNYLKKGSSYSRFVADRELTNLKRFNRLTGSLKTSDLKLIDNVYPYCQPALGGEGVNLMLTFVYDDPADQPLQNTEIAYLVYDGTSWSAPQVIRNDTRAEYNPRLIRDINGNWLGVWERVKDENFTGDTIEEMAQEMEIVFSLYDSDTGVWMEPQPITDNSYLDYMPVLSAFDNGDVMLAWISNRTNQMTPDPSNPSEINTAIWDGASWSAQTIAVPGSNLLCAVSPLLGVSGGAGLRAGHCRRS